MSDELYDTKMEVTKLHSSASEKSTELKQVKTVIEILKSEKRELLRNEAYIFHHHRQMLHGLKHNELQIMSVSKRDIVTDQRLIFFRYLKSFADLS